MVDASRASFAIIKAGLGLMRRGETFASAEPTAPLVFVSSPSWPRRSSCTFVIAYYLLVPCQLLLRASGVRLSAGSRCVHIYIGVLVVLMAIFAFIWGPLCPSLCDVSCQGRTSICFLTKPICPSSRLVGCFQRLPGLPGGRPCRRLRVASMRLQPSVCNS